MTSSYETKERKAIKLKVSRRYNEDQSENQQNGK